MTNKKAIELLKKATMFEPTLENKDYPEAFDLAIKALEQQLKCGCNTCEYYPMKDQRPQGEWIEIPVKRDLLYNTGIKYTCSNCGRGNCYGKPPFCMYCGAKMKGGAE